MSLQNNEQLDQLRHSAAHLLAAAVMQLYPKAKRTIGPSLKMVFTMTLISVRTKSPRPTCLKLKKSCVKLP